MEVVNTSTPISIPTTGIVMGYVDQTDILLEYSVLAKLDIISLHDITKLVRVEKHFISYRG